MKRTTKLIGLLAGSGLLAAGGLAFAAVGVDSTALRDAVTIAGVRAHQSEFQTIADNNGGTRASTTNGYTDSVQYVVDQLEAAGYAVTLQPFDYAFYQTLSAGALEQIGPVPASYTYGVDYFDMEYSGAADVTGTATAVDLQLGAGNASTSGCEATDFAGFPSGDIAIIQRGACTFAQKATNAYNAGAIGVIIFNQGNDPSREDLFGGTLSETFTLPIPVVSMTYPLGVQLAQTAGVTLRLFVDSQIFEGHSENVIAETAGGRDDRVVVVGAHLDSVTEGPGINDNGSGSAAILETALQMAALGIEPRNKVRFAWWGAEESGLIGSTHYVSQLSARDVKNIALNLNFDMVGSPNFVRFVYDGDGSANGISGPNGSGNIETVFLDYFADQDLATEPTDFDGRSDYGPFIAAGIPAGGLFTGAEEIKTPEQVLIYGGTAGQQYDPCYHLACDTFANNSDVALDQMSDAIAHAVLTYAMTTSSVKGTDKASTNAVEVKMDKVEYLGSHLQR